VVDKHLNSIVDKVLRFELKKVIRRLNESRKNGDESSIQKLEKQMLIHKQVSVDSLQHAVKRIHNLEDGHWKELFIGVDDSTKGTIGKLLQHKLITEFDKSKDMKMKSKGKTKKQNLRRLRETKKVIQKKSVVKRKPLNSSDGSFKRDVNQYLDVEKDNKQLERRFMQPTSMFLSTLDESELNRNSNKVGDGISKRNRMGQRARRQMFEKMYGKDANHIKNGSEAEEKLNTKQNDADKSVHPSWQASREKKQKLSAAKFEGTRVQFENDTESVNLLVKQINGNEVQSRKDSVMKKQNEDDKSVHPSWKASKDRKQKLSAAKFEGTRVQFEN